MGKIILLNELDTGQGKSEFDVWHFRFTFTSFKGQEALNVVLIHTDWGFIKSKNTYTAPNGIPVNTSPAICLIQATMTTRALNACLLELEIIPVEHYNLTKFALKEKCTPISNILVVRWALSDLVFGSPIAASSLWDHYAYKEEFEAWEVDVKPFSKFALNV